MKRRTFVAGSASVLASARLIQSGALAQTIDLRAGLPDADEIGDGWSLVDSNVILPSNTDPAVTLAIRAFYGGRSGRRVRIALYTYEDTEQAQAQVWGSIQQNIPYQLTEVLYDESRREELMNIPIPDGMIAASRIESTWNLYNYAISFGYYLLDVPVVATVRLEGDIEGAEDYTAVDRIASLVRSKF